MRGTNGARSCRPSWARGGSAVAVLLLAGALLLCRGAAAASTAGQDRFDARGRKQDGTRLGVVTSGTPPMGASVMLLGQFDWEIDPTASTPQQPWSRCLDQLWRAVDRSGSEHINFVPTHHFVAGSNMRVNGYCLMTGNNGVNTCVPWTAALVQEFRDAMTKCFSEALKMGLTIYIRPHLDDGTPARAWRNGLNFRPQEAYSGFSYMDIMLNPLADALRTALETTVEARAWAGRPKVYFSLQGEMGGTVARYPRDWMAIIEPLRRRIGSLADVLFGLGINFTGLSNSAVSTPIPVIPVLFGIFSTPDSDPLSDTASIKELIETKIGFIGVSAYAPMSGPGFALNEFENSAFNIGDDLQKLNVDLLGLIRSGQLELHYSEFGIGGGDRSSGLAASSASDIARFPFAGVEGSYSAARDPWQVPANYAFKREFYSKLSTWLRDPKNKTYRLAKVFLWCHASFDVLAVYPQSTTPEGSYFDPYVSGLFKSHNEICRNETLAAREAEQALLSATTFSVDYLPAPGGPAALPANALNAAVPANAANAAHAANSVVLAQPVQPAPAAQGAQPMRLYEADPKEAAPAGAAPNAAPPTFRRPPPVADPALPPGTTENARLPAPSPKPKPASPAPAAKALASPKPAAPKPAAAAAPSPVLPLGGGLFSLFGSPPPAPAAATKPSPKPGVAAAAVKASPKPKAKTAPAPKGRAASPDGTDAVATPIPVDFFGGGGGGAEGWVQNRNLGLLWG